MAASIQRQSVTELARLFNARIVDVAQDSMVIELTAKPDRIDAFLQLLKPYGVSEAARSGKRPPQGTENALVSVNKLCMSLRLYGYASCSIGSRRCVS